MIKVTEKFFRQRLRTEIRDYGLKDYKKVWKIINEVPNKVLFEIAKSEAKRLSDAVVERIERQPASWPDLNKAYLRSKVAKGLRPEMLIATEDYIESIGIQEVREGKTDLRVRVGVPNATHESSGLNYNKLGRIHEYGTSKIPARPHWGPAFDEWKRTMRSLTKRIQGEVGKKLEKRLKELEIKASEAKKTKS